jgi:hypothetical protein
MGIDMFTDKFTKVVNGLLTLVGIGNSSFTYAGARETAVAGADVTAKLGLGLEATAGVDTKIGAQHTFISGSLLRGNSVENQISDVSNSVNLISATATNAQNIANLTSVQVAIARQKITNIEQVVSQEKMTAIGDDLRTVALTVQSVGSLVRTVAEHTSMAEDRTAMNAMEQRLSDICIQMHNVMIMQ